MGGLGSNRNEHFEIVIVKGVGTERAVELNEAEALVTDQERGAHEAANCISDDRILTFEARVALGIRGENRTFFLKDGLHNSLGKGSARFL